MKQKSIKCPKCGIVSFNPNDVEERYCGRCREFHVDMVMVSETGEDPRDRRQNIYRDGKVHVMREQCDACLFTPQRLVSGATAAAIVRNTKDLVGATFACHKGTIAGEDAICRAWFDKFADQDYILRSAKALGIIEEVDDPTK